MIITAFLLVIIICAFLEEKRKVPPFMNYVMAGAKTRGYRSEPLHSGHRTYFKPVRENDCISVIRMTCVLSYAWTVDGRTFVPYKDDNSNIISSCFVYKLYGNTSLQRSLVSSKRDPSC